MSEVEDKDIKSDKDFAQVIKKIFMNTLYHVYEKINLTWTTEAPHWMNCKATSAESIPPIPKMGKPGRVLAINETALSPTGLVAFPDTPP